MVTGCVVLRECDPLLFGGHVVENWQQTGSLDVAFPQPGEVGLSS